MLMRWLLKMKKVTKVPTYTLIGLFENRRKVIVAFKISSPAPPCGYVPVVCAAKLKSFDLLNGL